MWKIFDGPKPSNPEADTLLCDILSLLRDCESGLQAINHMDKDAGLLVPEDAAEDLKSDFFARAVCVCNADGSISREEAALFCEIFARLMPLNLKRDDLQKACMLLQRQHTTSRKIFENCRSGSSWNALERADQLNGTRYASRYRELLVRMANMFASAEPGVNQQKIACVAEIERAISPLFGEAPGRLAGDIKSLIRDCENVIEALGDESKKSPAAQGLVEEEFVWQFAKCSFRVCNADGRASEEEAALHHEIFISLAPKKFFVNRHCKAIELMAGGVETFDRIPSFLDALEQNDRLNGTGYASRYREFFLRMANMLACAEGVRNQQKLMAVAELERALSRTEMTLSANKIVELGQQLNKLAEELNDPVKRIAQSARIVDNSGKVVPFTTLQDFITLDVYGLLTFFGCLDDSSVGRARVALWTGLRAKLRNVPSEEGLVEAVLQGSLPIDDVLRSMSAQGPANSFASPGLQLVQAHDKVSGTRDADRLAEIYLTLAKLIAQSYGKHDDRADKVVEEVRQVLFAEHLPQKTPTGPAVQSSDLEALLSELNALVGLPGVKSDVAQLANYVKVQQLRKQQGLKTPEISLHMVFYGNPGTGKTTVARLVAKIYQSLGVLTKGHLVETDRSGLVAGYVGQTALKVQEVVQRAIGGVLFVDEAYALTSSSQGSDFGAEAVDTLIKLMEDHRDDLVVIVAGYTGPMEKFLETNPGLKSRFNKYLVFEDYVPNQLLQIFQGFCSQSDYALSPQAKAKLQELFQEVYPTRDETFGNARFARNVFERAIANLASRIMKLENPERTSFQLIEPDDLEVPKILSVKKLGVTTG